MGFDRGVLPKDRDRDETFPWMGLLAIVVIVGGLLVIVLWATVWAVEPEPTAPADSRVVITAFL